MRNAFRELIYAIGERTAWHGPLPPPETLRLYNKVIPNGAERLFIAAERISGFEMKKQTKVIDEHLKRTIDLIGLTTAFIVGRRYQTRNS